MFYWLYHSYHPDGYLTRPLIIWLEVRSIRIVLLRADERHIAVLKAPSSKPLVRRQPLQQTAIRGWPRAWSLCLKNIFSMPAYQPVKSRGQGR